MEEEEASWDLGQTESLDEAYYYASESDQVYALPTTESRPLSVPPQEAVVTSPGTRGTHGGATGSEGNITVPHSGSWCSPVLPVSGNDPAV